MGYKEENDRKIEAAFALLVQKKDAMVLKALTTAMEEAVNYALDLHRTMDLPYHLENGDDYGWMIVHNRVPVGEHIYEGRIKNGTAKEELQSLRWVTSDTGWEAVVMAGMISAYYKWTHEEEILDATEGDLVMSINEVLLNAWKAVQ